MFTTLDMDLKTPDNWDQSCLFVLCSFYRQEQTNKFQGAMKLSPPFTDAAAAENESFEKEISVAKVTYDLWPT